jgi:hypothetical protein
MHVGIYQQTENKKTHFDFFLVIPFGQLSTPMGLLLEVVGGEGTCCGVIVVVVAGHPSGW